MKTSRVFAAIVCLMLMAAPACDKMASDEEALRRKVSEAEEAVEAKDLKSLMAHVSRDYYDDNGNDYKALRGILFFEFMKPGNINVFVRGVEVRVEGEVAVVDAKAFVVRAKELKTIADVIPEDAEGIDFSVVFRKEDGDWKVSGAAWAGVGLVGLL